MHSKSISKLVELKKILITVLPLDKYNFDVIFLTKGVEVVITLSFQGNDV